ncbi:tripartite motif-containing protein 2-like [Anneissia japonica]|uniref:tripartite motif-containing protein 2-like n=1 Tax=Anneissia japonica TaxID=1529436 RepID=UPI0014254BAA|nr:tripartite motif-containing protein 2-like [Anneissia japonica]
MSLSKVLQFVDDKDLECAICLSRFDQPKILKCMHTFCQQCIQKWMENHGKMKCPTCRQEHDLTKDDLKQLASNTMIGKVLEYVAKTEEQKPTKCSVCDNTPAYHCSTCQVYLCGGNCFKQHKILPSTKDHPIYTLDIKKQEDKQTKCPVHCNTTLEFYCSTCNKSACKQCEDVLLCYQKQHEVILLSDAVREFNKDVNNVFKSAHEFKRKLSEHLEFTTTDRSVFDLCRTAIKIHEAILIKKVTEKSQKLLSNLEEIYKEKNKDIGNINSKIIEVNNLMASINTMINKPEERETLSSHEAVINNERDIFLGTDFEQSFQKRSVTPIFIPSTHLDELINTVGIGKLTTADSITYTVDENDEQITVTRGQAFVVNNDACQLAAASTDSSDEKSATSVEYQGSGEYKKEDKCSDVEGDWQTTRAVHIKGSPVNVNDVGTLGIVHTIDNISDYKEHNIENVTDVVLDTEGNILVSSFSKDILKFNQSGSFVTRIQVPQDVQVYRMHQMGDGHIVYTDVLRKCVVMCDDKFQEIQSFGKGIIKYPIGLTVNNELRVLYVADDETHCVFKFNVDDGSLLGKIGSEGSEVCQMNEPQDVTLTKEGHVIVADLVNQRIQMFDASGRFMRILVGQGGEDSEIVNPYGVTMDEDENLIVSSNHKVQLFDKNGMFIKRIDDGGLDIPCGITVISKRPRRVAVADHGANNVKIFNY